MALAVSVSCHLEEPAAIDGLGPDPATDTLVITPQDITVPVGSVVIFAAPDQTVEGTPVTGPVEWTVAGGQGGTITTMGVFQASGTGDYTVNGKRSGKTGRSKVTVTSSPATLTSVTVAPNAVTLQPGATFTFAVSGLMSDGSTVPVTGTWTATGGTIDSTGAYHAGSTAGQFRVIVTQQGGTRADTAAVTISAAAPTLQAVEVTPTSVSLTPGGTQQFNAVGRMSDGSSASVTVTWSETGGSITSAGRYTAGSTAGSFRVIATQQGGTKADTSVVTITPAAPTLTGVEVTPSSVNLSPGAGQQFSAIGRMSDGSTSSVSVNWSATGGTVSGTGAYTAGATAGTFRVIATQQGGTRADTASVTIAVPPPTITLQAIELTPASASLLTGGTQQFSVVGRMSDNSTSSVAVTWSATGGTVSGSGLYTAGNTPGTWRIIAVEQGGTKADTSTITVSAPAPTLSAVELTPGEREPPDQRVAAVLRRWPHERWQHLGRERQLDRYRWHDQRGRPVHRRQHAGHFQGHRDSAGRHRGRYLERDDLGAGADVDRHRTHALERVAYNWRDPAVLGGRAHERRQYVGRVRQFSETGGTITAGGLYTAGSTAGTFRVIAVRQGDTKADTANVTITAPAPTLTAVEVTPTSASLAAGATQQFTAVGRMSDGSTTSVAVTWSETGGTISGTGLYTAGSIGGTFRVIAVQQGDTKADTASVTITAAAPTLSAVEVTPATASVAAGATQQFTAVGRMSDNSTSSVTVTWSATGGTIYDGRAVHGRDAPRAATR